MKVPSQGEQQKGVALVVCLIFVAVLALMVLSLGGFLAAQSRLSVNHQQSSRLFLGLHGEIYKASMQADILYHSAQDVQPGSEIAWPDSAKWEPKSDINLVLKLLVPGYQCLVDGQSSGVCLPMEISAVGSTNEGDYVAQQQVQGVMVQTLDVASGGDSRAGLFQGN